ncbi:SDR family NAD(P)-dependent oxidoreductase [Tautonia plasticadhaerens]|uniref:Ketoacyl reductase n=1 Tax=Tautonia plasticadhaerens TaxID=2527974 RepID=A0A518H1C0_9BACT|nr:SDR family oxidoreductase [Tautonia plasticadhaerens]QDV34644.1 Putative ketoacyl reductase [Tautonia plasticadhaerens]
MKDRTDISLLATVGVVAGVGIAAAALARAARRVDLSGRVVVITGGGRGLGFAIAEEFLRRGCRLAICGRDGEVIDRAVADFRRRGADAFGMSCDASDPGQVGAFVARVLDRFGTIGVLVNNAGQCFVGPAAELQAEDVEYALRNIFWSQYHPTMAVLPHMRSRRFGRIVNVTSIGGKVPNPHQAAYNAGKFAATGWSGTLAAELAKDGIRVSTVTPPPLDDGAPLHVHFNGRAEEEFAWFARSLTSPWSATDTGRAARTVVSAAEHGDPERAVTPLSWLMQRAQGVAPNLMSHALAVVDRRLPPTGPPGRTSKMSLGAEVVAGSRDERVRALGSGSAADEARYRPAPA